MNCFDYSGRFLKQARLWIIAPMIFLVAPVAIQADFTAANVQFVYGPDLEVEDSDPIPMWTLEVANGWKYGDNFFFTDIVQGPTYSKNIALGTYSELHSRLSFGKISGTSLGGGPISDILLAGEIDFPSGFQPTYCYGLGVDLKIPGFAFAFVNFFVRDEVSTDGVSFQINPVWMLPFELGAVKGSFGGWIDIMTGEGDNQEFWWQMQPTLFVDLGNFWGSPGKINVGVEYEYFRNFLGIKDWTINHPQAVVMWNI
jgi:nucleoside-specific outer membrane channel protein Tsx